MIIGALELKKLLKSIAAKDDVLLDSKSGMIVSISPDLTVAVRTGNFVSRSPFVVLVSGKQLGAVVNRMSGEIAIHLDGAALVLKSARAVVRLETREAKPFNPPEPKKTITLFLADIKPLLTWAAASAGKLISEQFGGVVKLKSTDKSIQAAGTDAARLALAEVPYDGPKFDYLIPLSASQYLTGLDGDVVEVEETDSYLHFISGNVDLYANKLSRDYPSYNSFIPKSFAAKYQVDSEQFRSALLTIKPVISNVGEPGISVHFLDNVCTLEDLGKAATDQVDYTQLEPEPMFEPMSATIRVSVDSLLSFFGSVSGPATISLNGPKQPIWLEAGNKQMMLAVLA